MPLKTGALGGVESRFSETGGVDVVPPALVALQLNVACPSPGRRRVAPREVDERGLGIRRRRS